MNNMYNAFEAAAEGTASDPFASVGEGPEVVEENGGSRSVIADIAAMATQDKMFAYSTYGARFRHPKDGDGVMTGTLAQGQVLPIWRVVEDGAVHQIMDLDLFQWTMVAAGGRAWLADRPGQAYKKTHEARAQDFYVDKYVRAPAERPANKQDLLMLPGGRVLLRVEDKLPILAPFCTRTYAIHPARKESAMTPQSWLKWFGESRIVYDPTTNAPQPKPRLSLVAIGGNVAAAGDDVRVLYDPTRRTTAEVAPIPELPISFSYVEDILMGDAFPPQEELYALIHCGVVAFLAGQVLPRLNPEYIGLAWLDTMPDGTPAPLRMHTNYLSGNTVAYRRQYRFELGEAFRLEVRDFDAFAPLARLANGGYDPELA